MSRLCPVLVRRLSRINLLPFFEIAFAGPACRSRTAQKDARNRCTCTPDKWSATLPRRSGCSPCRFGSFPPKTHLFSEVAFSAALIRDTDTRRTRTGQRRDMHYGLLIRRSRVRAPAPSLSHNAIEYRNLRGFRVPTWCFCEDGTADVPTKNPPV